MKAIHFFRGLSWLIILNLLIKPVWIFAIDRQVQNAVGYQEYGRYFSILNLSIVLSFIADAGLTNMVNRQLALANSKQPANLKQLLYIKLFFLLLYAGVVSLIAFVSGITRWDIVIPVIYIQAITSLFVFFRNVITANQLFTTDAWLSVIDKLLMTLICGAFIIQPLILGGINLPVFLYSQMFCTTIATGIAIVTILFKKLIPDASTAAVRNILLSISPFAIIILLMSAHNRLDGFLLERLHTKGAYEAGVYASAFRLLDAGNTAGYLAASFLVPFIARNKDNSTLIVNTVITLRFILILLGIAATTFIIMLAPFIEQLLYHTALSYNILILKVCIASLPAYYLLHIYGSVLTAMGQFTAFIKILILCVIINVLLNAFFIPAYGALACCVAALISQYSCGLLVMKFASKHNNITLDIKSLLPYVIGVVCVLILFLITRNSIT